MLTLVKRKTRYTIISEMPSHSAISVTKALDKIKEFFGSKFSEVFKSITVITALNFLIYQNLKKNRN